jgi:aspartate/methionine/tyrosine aminotransferase
MNSKTTMLFWPQLQRRAVSTLRQNSFLSKTAVDLPRSGIRDVMDAAWKLEKNLKPPDRLIHLEVGQPNFPPPESVLKATSTAVTSKPELSMYIPNAGLSSLREAVAKHHNKVLSLPTPLTEENIVVTHGAVGAVATLLQAILQPGDEILLPDPGWVNYEMATKMLGGVPVPYPLEENRKWKPDPNLLSKLCTEKTKAIMLCSPSNPTGAVLSKEEMSDLVDVCNERGLVIISDEIYSQIYFDRKEDQQESPSIMECDNIDSQRVCVVSGVSKAWAMTGFRVGWIVTRNIELASTCAKLLEASISCGVPFAQAGAEEALTSKDDLVTSMVDEYQQRRDVAVQVLKEFDMYEYTPEGAFYVLVHTDAHDSVDFCTRFLKEEHVAISPGSAFSHRSTMDKYVRVSLASNVVDLEEGLRRLCTFIQRERHA